MNIPEIKPYEEQAIDTVVSVLNRAREMLGERQTLKQLASKIDHQPVAVHMDISFPNVRHFRLVLA